MSQQVSPEHQQLIGEFQQLEEFLRHLSSEAALHGQILNDHSGALNTLTSLKSTSENLETFVPLGAGITIKAIIPKTNQVNIGIGDGYSVEIDITGAIEKITERIQQIKQVVDASREKQEQVLARMEEIRRLLPRNVGQ